jgi:hypothetical protein
VLETREDTGETKHLLENGMWIVEIGPDRYQTEWNAEEFWGRVDDGMTGTFGFVLLQVDRRRGLRLYSD